MVLISRLSTIYVFCIQLTLYGQIYRGEVVHHHAVTTFSPSPSSYSGNPAVIGSTPYEIHHRINAVRFVKSDAGISRVASGLMQWLRGHGFQWCYHICIGQGGKSVKHLWLLINNLLIVEKPGHGFWWGKGGAFERGDMWLELLESWWPMPQE